MSSSGRERRFRDVRDIDTFITEVVAQRGPVEAERTTSITQRRVDRRYFVTQGPRLPT
jgi:hypothetical protein